MLTALCGIRGDLDFPSKSVLCGDSSESGNFTLSLRRRRCAFFFGLGCVLVAALSGNSRDLDLPSESIFCGDSRVCGSYTLFLRRRRCPFFWGLGCVVVAALSGNRGEMKLSSLGDLCGDCSVCGNYTLSLRWRRCRNFWSCVVWWRRPCTVIVGIEAYLLREISAVIAACVGIKCCTHAGGAAQIFGVRLCRGASPEQ